MMRLQDIMNPSVETIGSQEKAFVANERMWRKQMHHLVVMDDQRVVGVISDTDLGGAEAREIPDELRVQDVMSRDTVTAEPTTTVDRAINIFRERGIHCLPVLDGDRLVGIVTSTDIENLAKRGTTGRPTQDLKARRGGYPPLSDVVRPEPTESPGS